MTGTGSWTTRVIDALFIDPRGPYPGLLGVEHCWDEQRDARTYAGPGPVVLHPPCNLWGPLANVNYARYGGEHNRPGNDGGLFAFALWALRMLGGVLEHPALSRAPAAHGIPKPQALGWTLVDCALWSCEVWQSAYGHASNKATRLLYSGARRPFDLCWERPQGTHQIGGGINTGERSKPRLADRLTHITPLAFAQELVRLAEWSRG